MSNLNLTWNVTSYNNTELEIQVNFFSPPHISTLLVQDKIVFHIRTEGIPFFISKPVFEEKSTGRRNMAAAITEPMLIDEDYRTLDRRVRKQMWNNNVSKQALKTFENTNDFLLYATAALFGISFLFAGAASTQF